MSATVEHGPALSILRVVSRLIRGLSLHDYSWTPRRKRPSDLGTGLWTTPLQDLA
jgi:hypothetical protein